MPDVRNDGAAVEEENPFADPAATAEVGDIEPSEGATAEGQSGSGTAPDGASPDGEATDFGGLSFKTTADLVNGYKNLQREYNSSREAIKATQEQLKVLLPHLLRSSQQASAPATPKAEEDPQEVLQAFTKDPRGFLNNLFQGLFQQGLGAQLTPLRQQLQSLAANNEVDSFMRSHPEITAEDEEALDKIFEERPWILQVPDRLSVALDFLKAKDPTRFSARAEAAKDEAESGQRDAKRSASMLGGKRSTVPKVAQPDEMDEVLAYAKDLRSRYADRA